MEEKNEIIMPSFTTKAKSANKRKQESSAKAKRSRPHLAA